MILLTSLIVLLLILIIAQLYRYLYKDNKEGFQQNDLYPIAPGENISNELESGTAEAQGSQARGATRGAGASNVNPTAPIAPYAFPVAIEPPPTGGARTPDHVFTQRVELGSPAAHQNR